MVRRGGTVLTRFGRTHEQRKADEDARTERRENWPHWFAWHPAKLEDGTWIWLSTVERRLRFWCDGGGNPNWGTQAYYREIEKEDGHE